MRYMRSDWISTHQLNPSLLVVRVCVQLTNYFDLGCTVLLLWYGGLLAMNDEGLTVGKLITFQLYWGMINSAYQQLMNIITQFTRAAGAATRVLSLMDSLPDIDPHAVVYRYFFCCLFFSLLFSFFSRVVLCRV